MSFKLKAKFAGIGATQWDWLELRAGDDAKADLLPLLEIAKSDSRQLEALRIMFAYWQLRAFLVEWLALQPDDRATEEARDEWASLQVAVTTKDWLSAASYLKALNARIEHVADAENNRPLLQVAAKVRATRKKAADTTNSKRKDDNTKRDARIAKCARSLIQATQASPSSVSRALVENDQAAGLGVKAVREILQKAGVIGRKTGVR